MTGAIESREARTVRAGSKVTRTIKDVTHTGTVVESTATVGLGHQLVVSCKTCNEQHAWSVSPTALVTTQMER
jgi:hypothetical protein